MTSENPPPKYAGCPRVPDFAQVVPFGGDTTAVALHAAGTEVLDGAAVVLEEDDLVDFAATVTPNRQVRRGKYCMIWIELKDFED